MLKPKRKLSRKQIKQDKLVTYYLQATDFLNHNSKLVSSVAIGLVVVVVLGTMIIRSKRQANVTAAGILSEASLYYEMQEYDKAIPILEKVMNNYSGTKNAGVATFYLANCYDDKNDYDNAEQYYRKYIDDYHDIPLLTSSAMKGVAGCLERQNKFSEAAQYYQKSATKFPELYNASEHLFLAARCYYRDGQKDKTKILLEKILDDYPDTEIKTDAQLLLTHF